MTTLRAPYLKAAIILAVLAALYGGFWLVTRKSVLASHFPPPRAMDMGHVARGFVCTFHVPPKGAPARGQLQLLFTWTCVPDCRTAPEPPDTSTFVGSITAAQTMPAVWHRACDGKPK